jgi:hypothetical protein
MKLRHSEVQVLCGFLMSQIQVMPENAAQVSVAFSTAPVLIEQGLRHVAKPTAPALNVMFPQKPIPRKNSAPPRRRPAEPAGD